MVIIYLYLQHCMLVFILVPKACKNNVQSKTDTVLFELHYMFSELIIVASMVQLNGLLREIICL